MLRRIPFPKISLDQTLQKSSYMFKLAEMGVVHSSTSFQLRDALLFLLNVLQRARTEGGWGKGVVVARLVQRCFGEVAVGWVLVERAQGHTGKGIEKNTLKNPETPWKYPENTLKNPETLDGGNSALVIGF